jgi:hypothetical protein
VHIVSFLGRHFIYSTYAHAKLSIYSGIGMQIISGIAIGTSKCRNVLMKFFSPIGHQGIFFVDRSCAIVKRLPYRKCLMCVHTCGGAQNYCNPSTRIIMPKCSPYRLTALIILYKSRSGKLVAGFTINSV